MPACLLPSIGLKGWREIGRAVRSSEELCGSSSDDDSAMWTEEFDEELDSISMMDDDSDGIALGA